MSRSDAAVLGLGLMGGSIAVRSRLQGQRVTGFDPDPARAARAAELGLIDRVAPTAAEACGDADAVILAAPVSAIVSMLREIDRYASPDAVVVDVGSVKRQVVNVMANLPGAGRMVGGHPLAGDERSGPEAATPALFEGKTFVLCPNPHTGDDAMERAERFVVMLGAQSMRMDASEHDRVLARTSHLPQALSSALALSLEAGDLSLSGSGLRDMTRLAASDPIMWRDILLTNADEVVDALRRCSAHLNRLAALMQMRDAPGVARFVDSGREAVADLS